jgi:Ca-activated chloride channel family protein
MLRFLQFLRFVLLLGLPIAGSAQALRDEFIALARPEDARGGSLAFAYEGQMVSAPLLEARYEVDVNGMLARTHLRQTFENTSGEWIEGVYVYPLPERAVVDSLELIVGERHVAGEIRERVRAQVEYEQAKHAGRRAGLVESERPNMFTTSVANIGPGERVTIEIAYQELVRFADGVFSLRLPLVVGPRYVPASQALVAPVDTARIAAVVRDPREGLGNPVELAVSLDAGIPIAELRSLYHAVQQRRVSASRREVSFAYTSVPADRDFVLEWTAPTQTPQATLFTETVDGEDYGLLMFVPPVANAVRALPREVVFVIDTSGSMDGTSITQARQALLFALERLTPADSFNIVRFDSSTQLLHRYPVAATAEALAEAAAYVRSLQSGGGTEMFPAINAALHQFGSDDGERVQQVVFITDGNVGNEADLFALIERELGNARLYTVGIGSAPNSYFMANAARFGRGVHTFIGDINEVSDRMSALFAKIAQPVLTDISIAWPDGRAREVYPQRISDLFAGEPLLVAVRGPLPAGFSLQGRMHGSEWSEDVVRRGATKGDGIARQWASMRVAALLEQRHRDDPVDPVYRAVVATALEHGLVTRYTSLLAVDRNPVRAPGQPLPAVAVPTNLPAGWSLAGLPDRLPAGGTSARGELLLGAVALLLACWLASERRQRV